MFDLTVVGAFLSLDAQGNPKIHFGLYLPGINKADGFSVVVLVIHRDDRFDPSVQPLSFPLDCDATHPLCLWSVDATIQKQANSSFGSLGEYLYRYQLLFEKDGNSTIITPWCPDPFARRTDIGLMSSVIVANAPQPFAWTDNAYKTPELNDLVVYELQVEEFNDTFDGVIDRLEYLRGLGVNCLELMPVTSNKLDFDWGYGPVYHFSPSRHFGGPEGLKRLVDAAHAVGIAVILDVVYEHVDTAFAYYRLYADIAAAVAVANIPHPASPMINGWNVWGFGPAVDWTQSFTTDFLFAATQMWLDEYHVDGFRYDEITDLYVGARAAAYQIFSKRVYRDSFRIPRFNRGATTYSRIIQCAESLGNSRNVLAQTYTNCAWTNDLLNKSEGMIAQNSVDDEFAHILDPAFSGYPTSQNVVNQNNQPITRPVAPFQYLESHDHSQLIVFAGTSGSGPLPDGNRDLFYKLQPYAIALYTCQGVPMLWQGQEFADGYNLPDDGSARVHLMRQTHWEYFYDDDGKPLIRLYRRLGALRRNSRALRGTSSYYYYQQSHQQNQVIAYHRYAPADGTTAEDWAMVLLNFGNAVGTITLPFPKAGTWREMLDDAKRQFSITVAADGETHPIAVNPNYGMVFVRSAI
jgi:maltooligosyltrehalose trehalohydrolase